MLEIKNLHAKVDGREILKGLDLTLPAGEVHAIMGPNGSGKSTLSYVLAGKDDYEVTEGSVTWNGKDLLAIDPSERAAAGVFLAFQYPMEIPGVATMTFLRSAVNAVRKARDEEELSTPDFLRLVKEKAKGLKIDTEMLRRPLNVGFSGGEKKRNEILQMTLLEPGLCVLDETDFRPRHRCLADCLRWRERAAQREALHAGHHPLSAAARTTSCPTGCMCWRTAGWRAPAALSLRSSSRSPATPSSAAKPRPRRGRASWTSPSNNSAARPSRIFSTSTPSRRKRSLARQSFVAALREKAIKTYGSLGLPHRRIEAWKYTDLRARIDEVHPLIAALGAEVDDTALEAALGHADCRLTGLSPCDRRRRAARRSVRHRRHFARPASRSSPRPYPRDAAGMAQIDLGQGEPARGRRRARAQHGADDRRRRAAPARRSDARQADPSHPSRREPARRRPCLPAMSSSREEGASATVLESYGSLGMKGLQRNAVTEIKIGDKAAIHHVKLQREAADALHLGVWLANIGTDARYNAFQLSTRRRPCPQPDLCALRRRRLLGRRLRRLLCCAASSIATRR